MECPKNCMNWPSVLMRLHTLVSTPLNQRTQTLPNQRDDMLVSTPLNQRTQTLPNQRDDMLVSTPLNQQEDWSLSGAETTPSGAETTLINIINPVIGKN